MENIYDRIRELRIKNGMTQEDLAKAVGYKGRSMIARIESGQIDISQRKIVLFASALGVSTDYLMDGSDEEARNSEEKRLLFRLANDARPEAIRAAVAVLEAMKQTNTDFGE